MSLATHSNVFVKFGVFCKEHPVLQAHCVFHVLRLVGNKSTSAKLHYNIKKTR